MIQSKAKPQFITATIHLHTSTKARWCNRDRRRSIVEAPRREQGFEVPLLSPYRFPSAPSAKKKIPLY